MASEDKKQLIQSSPTNGGDGPHSYARNSRYQKGGLDGAKAMIEEAIAKKLDVKLLSCLNTFTIADLGCSVGPNTFHAVKNVIEAVELKYQSHGLSSYVLEYQVFFNDQSSNDFNKLFTSLPPDRKYFASGVPGSFHGRLFPRASLHFVNSFYSLHALSEVPKEIVDKNSPAWNKGKIYYTSAPNEVVEAYSTQFTNDMESFFHARAQEIVCGGLMAFLIPGLPDETPLSQSSHGALLNLMGSCLMDMAKMGFFSEAKVDTFNLPIYMTSPQELKMLIERNGYFNIERMKTLNRSMGDFLNARTCSLQLRAGMEGLFSKHFGSDIIDELFDRFTEKIEESAILSNSSYIACDLLVVLKRKCD